MRCRKMGQWMFFPVIILLLLGGCADGDDEGADDDDGDDDEGIDDDDDDDASDDDISDDDMSDDDAGELSEYYFFIHGIILRDERIFLVLERFDKYYLVELLDDGIREIELPLSLDWLSRIHALGANAPTYSTYQKYDEIDWKRATE